MPDQRKPRAEETTADKAISGQTAGKVTYGGEEYTIKTLSLEQILAILRIIGGEMAILKAYLDEGSDQLQMFGAFIRLLSAEKVLALLAVILGFQKEDGTLDLEKAREGYRTRDALRVLRLTLKLEEVDELFLEVSAMAREVKSLAAIPQSDALREAREEAKAARASTPSTSASKPSAESTDTKTPTS